MKIKIFLHNENYVNFPLKLRNVSLEPVATHFSLSGKLHNFHYVEILNFHYVKKLLNAIMALGHIIISLCNLLHNFHYVT